MINLFIDDGGAAEDSSFAAALVRLSTGLTPGPLITWDTEVYDVGGWHDTSSNTGRMTVPGGVSLIRLMANSQRTVSASGAPHRLVHEKAGAAFYGRGDSYNDLSVNQREVNACGAIVAVSPGDWFNVDGDNSAAIVAGENTWFAIEKVVGNPKRALVRKSADQSISSSTTTAVTWSTEVYDEGGWFDTGTSNTVFTVPSGTSGYVRVTANVAANGGGDQAVLSIRKGGNVSTIGCGTKDSDDTSNALNMVSAVLAVSAGDTFDATSYLVSGAPLLANESTWFAIEEVLDFHGCLVYKSASQSLTANTPAKVAWAAEAYDTDTAHDNSTNNSRVTVPSGFSYARVSFATTGPSSSGRIFGRVLKNNAAFYGSPSGLSETAGGDSIAGMGAWVQVSPGDYFELELTHSASVTLAADNRTWMCVEFKA